MYDINIYMLNVIIFIYFVYIYVGGIPHPLTVK